MNGWQQLNRIDLEILDGISREWRGERQRMARDEYLLKGGPAARFGPTGKARLAALVLGAGLLAAVIIGLAMAVSHGGAGSLVLLGA